MIVIADTSPLNYLIRLGHAEVLERLYRRVLAPPGVLVEMQHPDAPLEVRAWAAAPPTWFEVMGVNHLDPSLAAELGLGERQAISLALELHADLLLIDEVAGRHEAQARDLIVAGTLAVLLQASLRGYLDFPNAITRLRRLKFRMSASIEATMLERFKSARDQGLV